MGRGRETAHVHADLGDDYRGPQPFADPSYLVAPHGDRPGPAQRPIKRLHADRDVDNGSVRRAGRQDVVQALRPSPSESATRKDERADCLLGPWPISSNGSTPTSTTPASTDCA